MSEIQKRLKSAADREKWATRGASFMAKAKATKAVWFPPKPVETGKAAASTAKKAGKKTTGAAKKTAKKATKKTSAAKKTTGGAKKVTSPVRRKQT